MDNYTIILASKSPRRRDILANAGYQFTVIEAAAEEAIPDSVSPSEAVTAVALQKASCVKGMISQGGEKAQYDMKNTIIIAADTMVLKDGIFFGKPKDAQEAFRMLKKLSDGWHEVYTGYAVLRGERKITGCEVTAVKFRELKDREIMEYINSGEPFDKAGSYGMQGRASAFVERINGDFFNVIGLPVCKIASIVDDFNSEIYT